MPPPLRLAVLADDLTGAADTGGQFCALLGPVLLIGLGEEGPVWPECPPAALAVCTNSRFLPAAQAAAAVGRAATALRRFAPELLYKKIDSCLRGNLGSELDAVVAATGAVASFVAPAYPRQGRTTVDGIHLVNGIPVAESEIGRDPLTPVRDSRLATLLAGQSRLPSGEISLACLRGGRRGLLAEIERLLHQGCRHILFDAAGTADLDTIATLVRADFPGVVPVGSAGLAASLASGLVGQPASERPSERPAGSLEKVGNWLFVGGSASRVLAGQLTALAAATGWRRLWWRPGCPPPLPAAGETKGIVLSIAPPESGTVWEEPARLPAGLADCAATLVDRLPVEAVFLSGGDTALAFLRRIGATGLLVRQEVLPGLMGGEVVGGCRPGLKVVTKAGAFGDEESLVRMVRQQGAMVPADGQAGSSFS